MNKGRYWDDVTQQLYKWDDLIKLLRKRNDNTSGVSKKEK